MFFIIKEIFAFVFGANYGEVYKYLNLSGSVGQGGTALSDTGMNIGAVLTLAYNITTNIIIPIADCLLIMYFVFNLIEMASNESFTLQTFGKQLAKFVVFHILIVNTFALMMYIVGFGSALVRETNTLITNLNSLATSTHVESEFLGSVPIMDCAATDYSTIKSESESYATAKEGKGFIKLITSGVFMQGVDLLILELKYSFLLLIPFLISVICYGSIILAALTRVIQIAIRLPLMPVAISDMYNGGVHSRGMGTMKGFIALAAQGMTILIIIAIGNTLCSSLVSGNLFSTSLYISIVKLAQISLLGKSLDVTKEMFGA